MKNKSKIINLSMHEIKGVNGGCGSIYECSNVFNDWLQETINGEEGNDASGADGAGGRIDDGTRVG